MATISILDMTPVPNYSTYGGPTRYRFFHSLPWVRTTDTVRPTVEAAYADAEKWAREYEARDRMGNMASAMGVAARDGGYVGVVNYFHSNT